MKNECTAERKAGRGTESVARDHTHHQATAIRLSSEGASLCFLTTAQAATRDAPRSFERSACNMMPDHIGY